MKGLDWIVRFLVGGLFIFSGLIKINDPVGTQIKLQEYFEVFASDFADFFHLFVPAAMELGMFLIILEVVLGVAVLIKYRMGITTWILLLLIIFFTFLTFYSAYFNKVTDCGCFGDAIPLTPWESFYKDVVLVVLIGYLFFRRNKLSPLFRASIGNALILSVTIITFFLGYYAIEHLPYIDFRAYKVGDNIEQNMQPEEQPIFEYTFRDNNGELIKSETYLPEDQGYEYVDYKITNPDKATPKIQDYNVWNESEGDFTQETFKGDKLIIIIQNVNKANYKNIEEINKLIAAVEEQVDVLAFTSSDKASFEAFRHEYQLAIPYFFVDSTVLKAMIRSNPGIILLDNGTVLGKWHYNDVPQPVEVLALADKNS